MYFCVLSAGHVNKICSWLKFVSLVLIGWNVWLTMSCFILPAMLYIKGGYITANARRSFLYKRKWILLRKRRTFFFFSTAILKFCSFNLFQNVHAQMKDDGHTSSGQWGVTRNKEYWSCSVFNPDWRWASCHGSRTDSFDTRFKLIYRAQTLSCHCFSLGPNGIHAPWVRGFKCHVLAPHVDSQ